MPAPKPSPAPPPQPPTLRQWVREHDESWVFVVLYLGLAVGLSVFVSLFWLVVVAGLHLALELARQAHYRSSRRSVVLHALWEVKLDVGLVLLALTLVLYIEVVLGILGVQSAARAAAVTRAGARVGAQAAAWERNLRTFLLTFDEMVRVTHAAVMLGRRRLARRRGHGPSGDARVAAPAPPAMASPPGPLPDAWNQRWKLGDRIGMGLVVVGTALILAAPLLTPHDWTSALGLLAQELRPFPGS